MTVAGGGAASDAQRPLVLTQAAARSQALSAWLGAAGVRVHAWPMTVLGPSPQPDWGALVRRVADCSWAILPSPGAIEIFMTALLQGGLAWPARTQLALIGAGSQEALAAWIGRVPGLDRVELVRADGLAPDAQALLRTLQQRADWPGQGVAVLCRADAGAAWHARLGATGAKWVLLPVYEVHPIEPPHSAAACVAAWAAQQAACALVVGSAEVGVRLARWLAAQEGGGRLLQQPVLTHHPRIAQALREHGWSLVHEHAPGRAALWQALVQCGVARAAP